MKLFAFYIGGKTETSFVEVHDVRFALGEKTEDCYAYLKSEWWGTERSLHIDCHGELEQIDAYNIELRREPYSGPEKLYFMNLGGYDPNDFSELHRNVFVVANDERAAKAKAMKEISDWRFPHQDSFINVESIINLNEFVKDKGFYVHLVRTEKIKPFRFTTKYTAIPK